jgi:hypothetical protein
MTSMRQIYDLTRRTGDFGVEIEVEADNLPDQVDGFNKEHDGSLRGEAAEFVFTGPCSKEKAFKHLDRLYKAYGARGTRLNNSYRCSVHVHVNVQEFNPLQLANFFILYATFEEYLVKYCGEPREGNLYCLRLRDAEYPAQVFLKAVQNNSFHQFATDRLKYSAVNLAAIPKFGSLEFRAMRGADTAEEIKIWIGLLDKLRTAALTYAHPSEIMGELSQQSPEGFARSVFGELFEKVPFTGNWEDVVYENIRFVQEIAYQPNYERYL